MIEIESETAIELNDPSRPESGSNIFSSTLTLFANTIGITLLLMPKLYNTLGIILGLIVLIVTAAVNFFTTHILARVADTVDAKSYHEVAFRLLSFRTPFNFFYFSLMIGNIICYHIFVLSSLMTTLEIVFPHQHNTALKLSLQFLMTGITNLMVLPFLYSKNLGRIRRLTKFASAAIVLGAQVIIIAYFFPELLGLETKSFPWATYDMFNPKGLYVSFGFILLSFCNHLVVVELNHEIRPKTACASKRICLMNVVLSILTYFSISLCGYLTMWDHQDINKMDNYLVFVLKHTHRPSSSIHLFSLLVLSGVAMANVTNYIPLIRYISFRNCLVYTGEEGRTMTASEEVEASIRTKETTTSIFFLIWAMTTTVFLLNFNVDFVFNAVSAISAPMICIILPAFFGLRAFKMRKLQLSFKEQIVLWNVILFGFAVLGFSVFSLFKIFIFR